MDTVSRRLLVRHIVGSGVEIGPGHVPFPLGPGTSVRYVDRWQPEENRGLFPELAHVEFPRPDIVADLNVDRLSALPDASQDFVIASHVLEHVAEPIGLLADIHRVLRPGGVVLILLPDRRRTFDRDRDPTTLAHLVAEYEAGITEIDDDHVVEFLEKTGLPQGATPEERRANIDLHLSRSIHVHCWTDEEFFPVLLYAVEHLDQRWEFVDGVVSDDEGPSGVEFGFLLRRDDASITTGVRRDRLDQAWRVWRNARLGLLARVTELEAAVAARQARLDRIEGRLAVRAYRAAQRVVRLR